jgi:hypothetical protein
MDVVVRIQDRDVLLLWTVPYVTNQYPSMDDIIHELAEPREFAEVHFPVAFTISQDGGISPLPSSQWVDFQSRMECLSETEEKYTTEQWRYDSIEIIRKLEPVYVWLDEFQRWFDWHIENERGFSDDQSLTLCFSPILPKTHAAYFKETFGNLGINNPQLHVAHFEHNDFKSATSAMVSDSQSIGKLNENDQAKPIESEPEVLAARGKRGKFEHAETTEWKAKAWELGETWMNEQRQKGKSPGVIGIAKYVEGELSNHNITGKLGRFLDWETIKREALTGITGRSANGKCTKGKTKTGDSPATKQFPQHKNQ